ncbi:MAG: hypothetical protein FJX80_00055 [Bacteroidetes bacterium]|nr:hypothetical protein [Bacteroidota bacterium]
MKTNKDIQYYKDEAERYRRMFNSRFSDLYSSEDDLNRNRLAVKEDQRLYRKVGKKFVPVNDPYAYDGLRNGFWLIQVKDGSTSIRQEICPDEASVHAAAREMEHKLVDIIRKAGEARPNKTPLSTQEKKDWDAFIAKHGESFNTLHYPSVQENAEKIVKVLIGEEKL